MVSSIKEVSDKFVYTPEENDFDSTGWDIPDDIQTFLESAAHKIIEGSLFTAKALKDHISSCGQKPTLALDNDRGTYYETCVDSSDYQSCN